MRHVRLFGKRGADLVEPVIVDVPHRHAVEREAHLLVLDHRAKAADHLECLELEDAVNDLVFGHLAPKLPADECRPLLERSLYERPVRVEGHVVLRPAHECHVERIVAAERTCIGGSGAGTPSGSVPACTLGLYPRCLLAMPLPKADLVHLGRGHVEQVVAAGLLHDLAQDARAVLRRARDEREPDVVAILAQVVVRDARIGVDDLCHLVGTLGRHGERAQRGGIPEALRVERCSDAAHEPLLAQVEQRFLDLVARKPELLGKRPIRVGGNGKARLDRPQDRLFHLSIHLRVPSRSPAARTRSTAPLPDNRPSARARGHGSRRTPP